MNQFWQTSTTIFLLILSDNSTAGISWTTTIARLQHASIRLCFQFVASNRLQVLHIIYILRIVGIRCASLNNIPAPLCLWRPLNIIIISTTRTLSGQLTFICIDKRRGEGRKEEIGSWTITVHWTPTFIIYLCVTDVVRYWNVVRFSLIKHVQFHLIPINNARSHCAGFERPWRLAGAQQFIFMSRELSCWVRLG